MSPSKLWIPANSEQCVAMADCFKVTWHCAFNIEFWEGEASKAIIFTFTGGPAGCWWKSSDQWYSRAGLYSASLTCAWLGAPFGACSFEGQCVWWVVMWHGFRLCIAFPTSLWFVWKEKEILRSKTLLASLRKRGHFVPKCRESPSPGQKKTSEDLEGGKQPLAPEKNKN